MVSFIVDQNREHEQYPKVTIEAKYLDDRQEHGHVIFIDFGGTLRASTYVNYFIGRQGFNLRSLQITVVENRMVACQADSSIWLPSPAVSYLLNAYMMAESSTGSDANLCKLFSTLLSLGRLKNNIDEYLSNMSFFNGLELSEEDIQNSSYLNISNALIMHCSRNVSNLKDLVHCDPKRNRFKKICSSCIVLIPRYWMRTNLYVRR